MRVDVYPTRDGRPVADLRKEDFEVLEDKVSQTNDQYEQWVFDQLAGQLLAAPAPRPRE